VPLGGIRTSHRKHLPDSENPVVPTHVARHVLPSLRASVTGMVARMSHERGDPQMWRRSGSRALGLERRWAREPPQVSWSDAFQIPPEYPPLLHTYTGRFLARYAATAPALLFSTEPK
jgi:hypothetical protein